MLGRRFGVFGPECPELGPEFPEANPERGPELGPELGPENLGGQKGCPLTATSQAGSFIVQLSACLLCTSHSVLLWCYVVCNRLVDLRNSHLCASNCSVEKC